MDINLNDFLYKSLGENDIAHVVSFITDDRREQIINSELANGNVVTVIYNFKDKAFRIEE